MMYFHNKLKILKRLMNFFVEIILTFSLNFLTSELKIIQNKVAGKKNKTSSQFSFCTNRYSYYIFLMLMHANYINIPVRILVQCCLLPGINYAYKHAEYKLQ